MRNLPSGSFVTSELRNVIGFSGGVGAWMLLVRVVRKTDYPR